MSFQTKKKYKTNININDESTEIISKWKCNKNNFTCSQYEYASGNINNDFKDEKTCLLNCNSLTLLPKDLMNKIMKQYMPRDYFINFGQTNKFFKQISQRNIIEYRLLKMSNDLKNYLENKINIFYQTTDYNLIQVKINAESVHDHLNEIINAIKNLYSHYNADQDKDQKTSAIKMKVSTQIFDTISDNIFRLYKFILLFSAISIYDSQIIDDTKTHIKDIKLIQEFKRDLKNFLELFTDIAKELWKGDNDYYYKFHVLNIYNEMNIHDVGNEISEYLTTKLADNTTDAKIRIITDHYMRDIQNPFTDFISQYLKQSANNLMMKENNKDNKENKQNEITMTLPEFSALFIQQTIGPDFDFSKMKSISELMELSSLLDSIETNLTLSENEIDEKLEAYLIEFIVNFLIFFTNKLLSSQSYVHYSLMDSGNGFAIIFYNLINASSYLSEDANNEIWKPFFNHFGLWSGPTNSIDLTKIKNLKSAGGSFHIVYRIWSEILLLILLMNNNYMKTIAQILIGEDISIFSPIKNQLKDVLFMKLDQIFDLGMIIDDNPSIKIMNVWMKIHFSFLLNEITDNDINISQMILPKLKKIFDDNHYIWSKFININIATHISSIK